MEKKIVSEDLITAGCIKITCDDGSRFFRCVEYIWEDSEKSKRDIEKGFTTVKSGIATNESESSFLNSMKRTSTVGRSLVFWDSYDLEERLGTKLNEAQAKKITELKDRKFKSWMESCNPDHFTGSFRASDFFQDNSIGTEVYTAPNSLNIKQVIKRIWSESLIKASEEVLNARPVLKRSQLLPRGEQERQLKEICQGLCTVGLDGSLIPVNFGCVESAMATGKTLLMYKVSDLLNSHFTLFTDTIDNTIQAAYTIYNYAKLEGKNLPRITIICSANDNDQRIREMNARVIGVRNGLSEDLENFFMSYKSEPKQLVFCTYASSNGFLLAAKKFLEQGALGLRFLDESNILSGKHSQNSFCSVLRKENKKLFTGGISLTGTPEIRPAEISDKNIVFNHDKHWFGNVFSVLTTAQAREAGQICDQKVLLYPIPLESKLIQAIEEKDFYEYIFPCGARRNIKSTMIPYMLAFLDAVKRVDFVSHWYIPCSLNSSVNEYHKLFTELQNLGYLDKKFKLFLGGRNNGNKAITSFLRQENAIIFGMRWMCRGTDTVKAKGFLPVYEPASKAIAAQTKGRTHRVYEVSQCCSSEMKNGFCSSCKKPTPAIGTPNVVVLTSVEGSFNSSVWYGLIQDEVKDKSYACVKAYELAKAGEPGKIQIGTKKDDSEENPSDADLLLVQGIGSNPKIFLKHMELAKELCRNEFEHFKLFTEISKNIRKMLLREFCDFLVNDPRVLRIDGNSIVYKGENLKIINLELNRIFQLNYKDGKLLSRNLEEIISILTTAGFQFIVPQSRNSKSKTEVFFEKIIKEIC